MTKNILITGGAGYIGSATTRAFLDNGYTVTVFDNLSTGQRSAVDERAVFIKGDVLDKKALRDTFDQTDYEAVVHLVALKSIPEGEQHPEAYFETNVEGTRNLLEAMKQARVPRVIFSSSAAVYGKGGDQKYAESMPLCPYNVYGKTKVAAEELIMSTLGEESIILRYFNVAGRIESFRKSDSEGLFGRIAYAVKNQESVPIFGTDYHTPDGTAIRDHIHVADIAHAHVDALRGGVSGVFNLGSGVGYSVKEVVAAFSDALKEEVSVEYMDRRTGDIAYSCADITKAAQAFGWKPRHTLAGMVTSTLDFHPE